ILSSARFEGRHEEWTHLRPSCLPTLPAPQRRALALPPSSPHPYPRPAFPPLKRGWWAYCCRVWGTLFLPIHLLILVLSPFSRPFPSRSLVPSRLTASPSPSSSSPPSCTPSSPASTVVYTAARAPSTRVHLAPCTGCRLRALAPAHRELRVRADVAAARSSCASSPRAHTYMRDYRVPIAHTRTRARRESRVLPVRAHKYMRARTEFARGAQYTPPQTPALFHSLPPLPSSPSPYPYPYSHPAPHRLFVVRKLTRGVEDLRS
ncbi:hypothetical protein B0H16DRAFT_1631135, partial [Mycena metata]